MESIIVHPQNEQQVTALKSFMKDNKIDFEIQKSTLPEHVIKSIGKSLEQNEKEQTISLEEFKKRHFS